MPRAWELWYVLTHKIIYLLSKYLESNSFLKTQKNKYLFDLYRNL